MSRDLSHRSAFEQHGETYVRLLAQREDEVGREAVAWLGEQQTLREDAAAKLRDAREEETLRLAKEANAIAERSAAASEKATAIAERSVKAARLSVIVAIASAIVTVALGLLTIFGK